MIVIDDHLVLQVLLGDEPRELRPRGGAVFTTGLWYHRLCRALADQTVTGTMSRMLGGLDDRAAAKVVRRVVDLPESIGLVSLHTLGWPMGQLVAAGHRLNLLSLEALAAAEHLGAEICLAAVDHNPPLRDAAAERGLAVRLIAATS